MARQAATVLEWVSSIVLSIGLSVVVIALLSWPTKVVWNYATPVTGFKKATSVWQIAAVGLVVSFIGTAFRATYELTVV